MNLLELMFDPTITTLNSKNGRFEDDPYPGKTSPVFGRSKVWLKGGPLTPPPHFDPRSGNLLWEVQPQDGSLLLSKQAEHSGPDTGPFVGVYFVPLQPLPPGTPLKVQGVVLFGREPGGLQSWASPFATATGITQSLFVAEPAVTLTHNDLGYYISLKGIANAPIVQGIAHHYEFLVSLVAFNAKGDIVGQWSHDPEMDVSM